MLDLARNSTERGWWQRPGSSPAERLRTLVTLERDTGTIATFDVALVPGLLHTGEYWYAVVKNTLASPAPNATTST